MNKKILLVGPFPPPVGGMSVYMEQLYNLLKNKGIKIYKIDTIREGKKYKKSKLNLTDVFFTLKILYIYIEYLLSCDIKIVHIHTSSYWSFWQKMFFLIIAKFFGKKTILHIHGGGFEEFYSKNKLKKIIIFLLQLPNKIVVLSEKWKTFYSSLVKQKKIVIVKNFVSYREVQRNCLNKFQIKKYLTNDSIILFMGALLKEKGVLDLLKLASVMTSNNIKFVICGKGELEPVVKEEVKKNKNLLYLGEVDGELKYCIFKNTKIFILPSYIEGLPMVLLEAMSYSIPIITTYVGGIPDIIKNGTNGVLVKPGDIIEMKHQIDSLLNDKHFYSLISKNAFKTYSENFTDEIGLRRIIEIYNSI